MRYGFPRNNTEARIYFGFAVLFVGCYNFYYRLAFARGHSAALGSALETSSGYHIPVFVVQALLQLPVWLFFIALFMQFSEKFFREDIDLKRLNAFVTNIVYIVGGFLFFLGWLF
jgi:hypothetical protein